MEPTTPKVEPLVSDEFLGTLASDPDWPDGPQWYPSAKQVRNMYEADRTKTRAVVQALCDALKVERDAWHELHDGNCETLRSDEALARAEAELNITPQSE